MKSVVACTPLNSIFTGFNHRPQWFRADTTVRAIKARICLVTCCSQRSSFGSSSKASLKSCSQLPSSSEQRPRAPRRPPFSSLCIIHAWFWSKVPRHATLQQKLCGHLCYKRWKRCRCCRGIDINWPFQRLPSNVLWSALLYLFFFFLIFKWELHEGRPVLSDWDTSS